jgi:hypothetical protein
MCPIREAFTSYKPTPQSYVILADKSKVPCLGTGTVMFTLQDKNISLRDVLHVPKLQSPLLSVRCYRRLKGCCFLADNSGSFLTFPHDSSDCTIARKICSSNTTTHFDSSLAGCISAVSDNTRLRKNHRPIIPKNTPKDPTISTNESNLHLSTDLPTITEMDDTPLIP